MIDHDHYVLRIGQRDICNCELMGTDRVCMGTGGVCMGTGDVCMGIMLFLKKSSEKGRHLERFLPLDEQWVGLGWKIIRKSTRKSSFLHLRTVGSGITLDDADGHTAGFQRRQPRFHTAFDEVRRFTVQSDSLIAKHVVSRMPEERKRF